MTQLALYETPKKECRRVAVSVPIPKWLPPYLKGLMDVAGLSGVETVIIIPARLSYFVSLSEVAHAWLRYKESGKLDDLKNFRNQYAAEPWAEDHAARSEDAVLALCDDNLAALEETLFGSIYVDPDGREYAVGHVMIDAMGGRTAEVYRDARATRSRFPAG